MTLRTTILRRVLVSSAVFILAAGAALADYDSPYRWSGPRTFQRFSIALDGGFGLADGHNGLFDAKTEFQFGFSRHIRIGFGVGYLSGGNGWGRDGRFEPQPTEMAIQETDGDNHDKAIRALGPGRNYQIMPISLNLYYVLPLGRRWNLFASGGGSFYFGWFHGADIREHKTTWGGQGGLGAEYRLSRRLSLIAQGEYRFAEFGRLAKLSPEAAAAMSAADQNDADREMKRLSHVALNGVSFHLGAKFGF